MIVVSRCIGGILGVTTAVIIAMVIGYLRFDHGLLVEHLAMTKPLLDQIALLLPGPALLHHFALSLLQFVSVSHLLAHTWGVIAFYCMAVSLIVSLLLLVVFIYCQKSLTTWQKSQPEAASTAWSWQKVWLLLIASLVFLLGSCDFSIIIYALPRLTMAFDRSADHIWILLTCFGVGYASVLMLSGYWADHRGYRQPFLAGLMLLLLSSLTGAVIYFSDLLLFGTAILQGAGLGLAWPGVQAIVMRGFNGKQQRFAMGIIFMAAGIGMSLAAFLGNGLADDNAWNLFMLVTGLSALFIWLLAYALLPKKVNRYSTPAMGFISTLMVLLASVAFLYGLHAVSLSGFDNINGLIWLLAGLVLGLISLVHQLLRYHNSLLLPLLSKGHYLSALVCRVAAIFSYILIYFMLTMYLINVLSFSLFETNMIVLPLFGLSIISTLAFGCVTKGSPRLWLFWGMFITLCGLIWLVSDHDLFGHVAYWFIPFAMMGIGLGVVFSSSNLFALRAIDKNHIGFASGVLYFLSYVMTNLAIGISIMIARSGIQFQLHRYFFEHDLPARMLSDTGLTKAIDKMQLVSYVRLHWPHEIASTIAAGIDSLYQNAFQYVTIFAIVLMVFAMVFLGIVRLSEQVPEQDKIKHTTYPCF